MSAERLAEIGASELEDLTEAVLIISDLLHDLKLERELVARVARQYENLKRRTVEGWERAERLERFVRNVGEWAADPRPATVHDFDRIRSEAEALLAEQEKEQG